MERFCYDGNVRQFTTTPSTFTSSVTNHRNGIFIANFKSMHQLTTLKLRFVWIKFLWAKFKTFFFSYHSWEFQTWRWTKSMRSKYRRPHWASLIRLNFKLESRCHRKLWVHNQQSNLNNFLNNFCFLDRPSTELRVHRGVSTQRNSLSNRRLRDNRYDCCELFWTDDRRFSYNHVAVSVSKVDDSIIIQPETTEISWELITWKFFVLLRSINLVTDSNHFNSSLMSIETVVQNNMTMWTFFSHLHLKQCKYKW